MRGQGRVQDRVHKQVGKKREAQHRRQYTPHTLASKTQYGLALTTASHAELARS